MPEYGEKYLSLDGKKLKTKKTRPKNHDNKDLAFLNKSKFI